MLPMMNLQSSDIATFENGLNSSELLPQEALEPSAAFADILRTGVNPGAASGPGDGRPLPHGGNELPPQMLSGPETAPTDESDDLAIPLPETVRIELLPAALPNAVHAIGHNAIIADLDATAAGPKPGAGATRPVIREPQFMQQPGLPAGSVDGARLAEDALLTRGSAASMAMPQPGPATEKPLSQVVRELTTASLASGTASKAVDEPRLTDRRPIPDTTALRSAGKAAGEDLPREFRLQAPAAPVVQAAQPQLNSAGPIEAPAGQATQATILQAAQAPAQTSNETTSATAQLTQSIDTPVREPAWGERIGERVLLMASNRLQSAEIRLTPAELGPLRVRVSVDDGAANVTFHAQHAVTREAIEQALPRLRELLAENGLMLNQTSIGESAGQGVQHGGREDGGESAHGAEHVADSGIEPQPEDSHGAEHAAVRSDSLVDTFA